MAFSRLGSCMNCPTPSTWATTAIAVITPCCSTSNAAQAGFHREMLIPVQILPAATSELGAVKRAVASNIQRSALSDIGKIRAAVRMKHLGATNIEIAQTLGMSDSTVGRLLILGGNQVWLQHVVEHNIPSSTAVRLLQAAEAEERLVALTKAFDAWCADTRTAVEAEDSRRRANDEDALSISDKWLQRYLKPDQVNGWIDQLRSGRPLGPPEFRYRAMIRKGDGPQRLEIDGIKKDLDGLSLEALGKIAGRIADLDADLQQALREKHAAEQEGRAAVVDSGEEEHPARSCGSSTACSGSWTARTSRNPTTSITGSR